jgi:hypothetical protein
MARSECNILLDSSEGDKRKKRVDPFSVYDENAETKGRFEIKEEIHLKVNDEPGCVKESQEAQSSPEAEISERKARSKMREEESPGERIEYHEKVHVRSGCMPVFGCGDRSVSDKAITFDQFFEVMIKKIGEERVIAGDVVFESSMEFE